MIFFSLLTAHVSLTFSVKALINLLGILIYFFEDDANCLPVPVSTWCRLDESKRKQLLSSWPPAANKKPWSPVTLPYIDDKLVDIQPAIEILPRTQEGLECLIRAAIYLRERHS